MSIPKKVTVCVALAVLFGVFAVGGLEAKCRSSKQTKGMGCCNMKDMDMGGEEDKTGQASHSDMKGDCCAMMGMKGNMQKMPAIQAGGEKSSSEKIVQSQRVGDWNISILNDRGQLSRGENTFCLEFRNARTNEVADAGNVQVEFTMPDMGGMRAVAQIAQDGAGRYCGRATLSMTGEWSAVVKDQGSSGRDKAGLSVTVR